MASVSGQEAQMNADVPMYTIRKCECENCKGSGIEPGQPCDVACSNCEGTGWDWWPNVDPCGKEGCKYCSG